MLMLHCLLQGSATRQHLALDLCLIEHIESAAEHVCDRDCSDWLCCYANLEYDVVGFLLIFHSASLPSTFATFSSNAFLKVQIRSNYTYKSVVRKHLFIITLDCTFTRLGGNLDQRIYKR